MYKLYGSTTSPYVRRIRILLANIEHEFVNMQIYQEAGREVLITKNPAMKVPALEHFEDGKSTLLYDSRVIYRYLCAQHDFPGISWEQENQLTLIDAVNDSLVQMFQLSQSDVIADTDKLFFKLQKERVNNVLAELDEQVQEGLFDRWHYPAICLYSLIDWIEFRNLHNLKGLGALLDFHQDNTQRIEVTATDPRM
jgi:glutathione S-transferase